MVAVWFSTFSPFAYKSTVISFGCTPSLISSNHFFSTGIFTFWYTFVYVTWYDVLSFFICPFKVLVVISDSFLSSLDSILLRVYLSKFSSTIVKSVLDNKFVKPKDYNDEYR